MQHSQSLVDVVVKVFSSGSARINGKNNGKTGTAKLK